jgi:putative FmdB family regulatory protein
MPTYDFTCQNCNQRFDVFMTYSEYGTRSVTCSYCGSENVRRRMTRVRVLKSEDSRLDDMEGDMGGLEGLEEDPKALGHMMRKMGKQMGEELPPEFDDVVDRLEAGQSPEEIESALPDIGNTPAPDDDF